MTKTRSHVWLICLCVLPLLALAGCRRSDAVSVSDLPGLKLDVRVNEEIGFRSDGWSDYVIYKCTVTDPRASGLVQDQSINIVAALPDAAPPGRFIHANSDLPIKAGKEYHVAVSVDLPEGWDSIASSFSDPALGLAALLGVEKAK